MISLTELISMDLTETKRILSADLGKSYDLVMREIQLFSDGPNILIVFLSSLADTDTINEHVLKPIIMPCLNQVVNNFNHLEATKQRVSVGELKETQELITCMGAILKGDTVLFVEGFEIALIISTAKPKSRSVEEPISETVVRGPRDGFIETLSVNISLLRSRISNPAFTMVKILIGRTTKKEVVVSYIRDIANDELVSQVITRVQAIDIDDIPESGYIEQLIEDNPYSPFPQLMNTERPDKVISALLEGRVAILLDGTPFVLLAPVTFPMLLQSPEDYYERWIIGSLIRMLRYIAILLTLFLPAIYIAFTSYHQGLIPTRLAVSIASSREGVPFPTFIEALMMEFTIELLREAGVRLPKNVGQAVGIVGGLVIGQSAVDAGIVSPFMVIVVAVTAISSFAIPHYSIAISMRILRFSLMLAASVLGLYGILLSFLLICSHLVKQKSFGYNYAAPFVHIKRQDWKDTFFRAPLRRMKDLPTFLRPKKRSRV